MGVWKKMEPDSSPVAFREWTRDNGHKLKFRKFPLSIRKAILLVRGGQALEEIAQRGCGMCLEMLQTRLNNVLGNLL